MSTTNMHPNSVAAYKTGGDEFSERELIIIEALRKLRVASDRQIAAACGFAHKSAVQPRISDLVKRGALIECGKCEDPITGKGVRVVRLAEAKA